MNVLGFWTTVLRFVYSLTNLPIIRFLNLQRWLDVVTATLPSFLRLGSGARVAKDLYSENSLATNRPLQPLQLYEFEACPFCRKVREILSYLDIDYVAYPCPRETMKKYGVIYNSRYRPFVLETGGKVAFPFLIDPNTNEKMYDSDKIIDYLFKQYGQGIERPPLYRLPVILNLTLNFLCGIWRPFPEHGIMRTPSKTPKQNLELWQYEASPYCRLVREALTTLELPCLIHNVARGSTKRESLKKRTGKAQVPFFFDSNTNTQLFDSREIISYLYKTYKTGPTINENLSHYKLKKLA